MAFDDKTRRTLFKTVTACRNLLTEDFDKQLRGRFGIYADEGRVLEIDRLVALNDAEREIARVLRDRIGHLSAGNGREGIREAVERILREQAFTILNRFAAVRMAEERGIISQSVGAGLQSRGFRVFENAAGGEQVTGAALGPQHDRYLVYLECLFDELSLDLGILFDRSDAVGLLFPTEGALRELFDELNRAEIAALWSEDETIGWIYQYYNDPDERKKMRDESSAPRNSRELAVRNQFFTPRYVVEFLTDNTLGRIWYDMVLGRTRLKGQCRYLVRRPDEVFLAEPSSNEVRAAQAWLQTGGGERPDLWHLAHTVNGYAYTGEAGEASNRWVEEYPPRIKLDTIASLTTQELLDLLFLFCHKERFCEGTIDSLKTEIELILSTIENRSAKGHSTDLSQEDLLKQPVFIPPRLLKDPRTILMLDPACGSMHFGLYAFDLFEVIYDEAWALEEKLGADALSKPPGMKSLHDTYAGKSAFLKDVPRLIIEHNLHGIDIDPRCAQIAGLSLWLRAQKAWQRLGLKPAERPAIKRSNIVCAEPMPGEKELLREFVEREFPAEERGVCLRLLEAIFDKMQLAGEAGSLLSIEEEIHGAIEDARKAWRILATKPRELFTTTELNQISIAFELTGQEQAASSPTIDPRVLTTDFWEHIEERIYAALRDYAEQAENGGGFQRRLFAEDAARGFAFIDVCRKRYDVALMNPPFGLGLKEHFDWLKSRYPDGYVDFFAAFIERMTSLCSGRIGAITSRSILIAKKLERLRANLVVPRITELLDLGWPVMDGATVQSCAYSIDLATHAISPHFVAVDRKSLLEKAAGLDNLRVGGMKADSIYFVERSRMQRLPRAKILYNLLPAALALFDSPFKMGESLLLAKFGMRSFDDFRFLRLRNEINPDRIGEAKEWEPLAKGGPFAIFYSDLPLLVRWSQTGAEIAEVNRQVNGQIAQGRQASTYYRLPGATYSRRCKDFGVRVLPAGFIIGEKGPSIMPLGSFSPTFLVGILNSRLFNALINLQANAKQYDTGIVEGLPWREFPDDRIQEIAKHARIAIDSVRRLRRHTESEALFTGEVLAKSIKDGHSEARRLFQASATTSETSLSCINRIVDDVFNVDSEEIQALVTDSGDGSERPEQDDPEADEAEVSLGVADFASGLMSFLAGCTFGRWDIRYATGEQAAPELPDPFAPLPVCPPGQLQNAQGLPARPEDVPAAYPVRIPWEGILVDDPNHPEDIIGRVRGVLNVIWSDKAEAIEAEACEILKVKAKSKENLDALRIYFRDPNRFFKDHLARYSKSRRKAPIYWPISTESGSYTLWIYYHRLDGQTLYTCVSRFIDPKREDIGRDIEGLRSRIGTGGTVEEREKMEDLANFHAELKSLRDLLLQVASLPYHPNLNDGVQITAAPLWKCFLHAPWQKVLKDTWKELVKGDYDWANLALSIWPDRVKTKCKSDRSFAIAHDLEDLCEVKVPAPKKRAAKKTAKKSATAEEAL